MLTSFLVLSALLFVFCIYIGFQLGSAAGTRAVTTADYWKMNAAAVIAAVLLTAALSGFPLLYSGIIGLLAGGIVGLKMAFGESTGPWKAHDRAFNVNKAHRETAEKGTGRARRERRRSGEQAPDLISVDGSAGEDTKRKR